MSALTGQVQSGKLFYTITGNTLEVMVGDFYLDGDKVIARKYRGRNTYHLTNTNSVIGFEPTTTTEAK
jgi:hypothetical protein